MERIAAVNDRHTLRKRGMVAGAIILAFITIATRASCTKEAAIEPAALGTALFETVPADPAPDSARAETRSNEVGDPNKQTAGTISGTLLIFDAQGTPHVPDSGFLRWQERAVGSTESGSRSIGLIHGRWELSVAPDTLLRPMSFVDPHGRVAQASDEWRESRAFDGLPLQMRWTTGVLLHVLDAQSKAPLAAVRLLLPTTDNAADLDSPQPSAALIAGARLEAGSSPVALPVFTCVRSGWVGAEGWAWKRFAFSGTEGEAFIELQRGARLQCRVSGASADVRYGVVRIYSSENPLLPIASERWSGQPAVAFDGLPVGRCVVTFEHPGPPNAGSRRVQVAFELVSGMNEIVLDLSSSSLEFETGSLSLLINAASETALSSIKSVLIRSIDAIGRDRIAPVVLAAEDLKPSITPAFGRACHIACLLPGRYRVEIAPLGVTAQCEIQAGQEVKVEIDLPLLVDVTLWIESADSAARLHGFEVLHRPFDSNSSRSWSMASYDMGRGCYTMRLAPGRAQISAQPSDRRRVLETIEVTDATHEFVLVARKLEPELMRLRSRQSSAEFPLPQSFWAAIEVRAAGPFDGNYVGLVIGTTDSAGQLTSDAAEAIVEVVPAGRYSLHFPKCPGYLPLADMQIDVARGVESLVILQLELE